MENLESTPKSKSLTLNSNNSADETPITTTTTIPSPPPPTEYTAISTSMTAPLPSTENASSTGTTLPPLPLTPTTPPTKKPSVIRHFYGARIGIFWDFENAPVSSANSRDVVRYFRLALESKGYTGTIEIHAYADFTLPPAKDLFGISYTGVSLCHVPYDGKDCCDKKMLADIFIWALAAGPSPCNVFVVSGDKDFSYSLHSLRDKAKVNILLSQPAFSDSSITRQIASTVWLWNRLCRGRLEALRSCEFSLLAGVKDALNFLRSQDVAASRVNIYNFMRYSLDLVNILESEVEEIVATLVESDIVQSYEAVGRAVYYWKREGPGFPVDELRGEAGRYSQQFLKLQTYMQSKRGLKAKENSNCRFSFALKVQADVFPHLKLGLVLRIVRMTIGTELDEAVFFG